MKIMKKIVTLILVAAMLLTMTGCGGGAESVSEESTEQENESEKPVYKIGLSMDMMSEGNAVIIRYMEEWVENHNSDPNSPDMIEFRVYDADSKLEKQLNDVETLIADEFDAVIISSVDNVGSIPAAEAAHEAGLFVVDNRGLETEAVDVYLKLDEFVMTEMMREYMQRKLDEDPNWKWNVGLVYGSQAQTMQLERCDFVQRWIDEGEDRVNIVEYQYCDWDTEKAMKATEDWLQLHDDINIIVAANIGMAQGVSAALSATGRRDGCEVVTYDVTNDTLLDIRDGVIDVSVGTIMSKSSTTMIELAYQGIRGEYDGPKVNTAAGIEIVDINNYAEFLED